MNHDLARSISSIITLTAAVLGLPIALALMAGWPLPTTIPSIDEVDHAVRLGIDDRVIVKAIALVGWIAWIQISAAVAAEATATLKGRVTQQLPLIPNAFQAAVRQLLASATLTASISLTPNPAHAAVSPPVPPVELAGHLPATAIAALGSSAPSPDHVDPPPGPEATTAADHTTIEVQRHDSWWSLAEEHLGAGHRWRDLRAANIDRVMPDGTTIRAETDVLQPGWTLVLPATGSPGSAAHGQVRAAAETEEVTVAPGDNLWSIAEQHLADATGQEPTNGQTTDHWYDVIEASRDHLVDPANPDLIYPDQNLPLPSVSSDSPATAPDSAEPRQPAGDTTSPGATTDSSAPSENGNDNAERAEEPSLESSRPDAEDIDSSTPATAPTTSPPASTSDEPAAERNSQEATSPSSAPVTQQPTGSDSDETSGAAAHEDLDDQGAGQRWPIGATALLAGLVLAVLARRRRARRRANRPAVTVSRRERDEVKAEQSLGRSAGDVLAIAEHTSRVLSEAFAQMTAHPPAVTGLLVTAGSEVKVHFSEPIPAQAPFDTSDDAHVWRLPASHISEQDDHQSEPALCTLVSLGRTDTGDWALVDVESLGALELNGSPDETRSLLRSIGSELALHPLHHLLDLVTTSEFATPNPLGEGSVTPDGLDEPLVLTLEQAVRGTDTQLEAEDVAHTASARARGVAPDGLVPSIVLSSGDADPTLLNRLVDAALPGGRGLGLVTTDPLPADAHQVVFTDHGQLMVPFLNLTLHPARLTEDDAHQLDAMLDREPTTPSDDEVGRDVEGASNKSNGKDRPGEPAISSPSIAASQGSLAGTESPPFDPAEERAATASADGSQAWRFCVRLLAGHRVEDHDGSPISFRYGQNPDVPHKNTHRGPELIAYLALNDRTATIDRISDDLWWGRTVARKTVEKTIYGTRKVLGGPDLLSYGTGAPCRYQLSAEVLTDIELLDQALTTVRQADGDTDGWHHAYDLLRPHLARIETPPFHDDHMGRGLADWATAHGTLDDIEQPIIAAAHLLTDLAGDNPERQGAALWATMQALITCPTNEALVRTAMQLNHQLGHRETANRLYQALTTKLAADHLEPEPATTQLRERITAPARKIG